MEPRSESAGQAAEPLFSSLSGDPEMVELVDYFVGEMPARLTELRTAFEAFDMATLRRLTHQLKGAAGGYGFAPIGESAGEVERLALTREADVDELRERVESLIDLCRRATANRK